MKVYHGCNVVVKKPRLLPPNRTLDFGPGFYTTASEKQAADFAVKVLKRSLPDASRATGSFVSIYDVDFEAMRKETSVLRFTSPDEAWFDFVWANRSGVYSGPLYDVIYGPVANDTIYRCLIGYEAGLYSKAETIKRLKTRKLYDQMTFATDKALSFLHFFGFREVAA